MRDGAAQGVERGGEIEREDRIPFGDRELLDRRDVLLAKQPTKRFVQPEEVGALALFLCREEAGNVTGANWSIDGGWTAE